MPNPTNPLCQRILKIATLLASALGAGCTGTLEEPIPAASLPVAVASVRSGDQEPAIRRFCGNCHAMPDPRTFPKDAWYEEVERGYEFYLKSGRTDLDPPAMQAVVRYFRERAPDRLELPVPPRRASPWTDRFRPEPVAHWLPHTPPAISNLHAPPSGDELADWLVCDAQSGEIRAFQSSSAGLRHTLVARAGNPGHIAPSDLDGDGVRDWVVADLGSTYPADHQRGKVTWLTSQDGRTEWTAHHLHEGLGRVADVRPGDFDGDGRIDLIVAVFGWHQTGEILWLKQIGSFTEKPQFESIQIDSRPGAIHLPTCDLNQDGKLDFIALISQHYETVEAFVNDGAGSFRRELIFEAQDPSFGSSGIELVDLDQDGDLDVLYTHGDSFDSRHLKPSHGVHWLENEGRFPFRAHRLVSLPGAYRALAADFDRDQDLDVIVSSFVARSQVSSAGLDEMASLLLLEQIEPGKFQEHVLETGQPNHAAMEVVDLDRDGDWDVVTGTYASEAATSPPVLTLWRNQGSVSTVGKGG